jgi:hypothetical protein
LRLAEIQVSSSSTLEALTLPEISTPLSPTIKVSSFFLSVGDNNVPATVIVSPLSSVVEKY